jgi:hypothetical protein
LSITQVELLSPLRGFDLYCSIDPRLTPWATLYRPSGALNITGIISRLSTDDGQCDGRFGDEFFLLVHACEDFRFRDDERSSGA